MVNFILKKAIRKRLWIAGQPPDDNKELSFSYLFIFLLPSSGHLDILQALSGSSLPLYLWCENGLLLGTYGNAYVPSMTNLSQVLAFIQWDVASLYACCTLTKGEFRQKVSYFSSKCIVYCISFGQSVFYQVIKHTLFNKLF